MEWITDPQSWIALATLTALEIVLGIDNIIFITILANKLPAQKQPKARTTGIVMAMLTRILLLFSLTWLMGLTRPLFSLFLNEISGRDIILVLGGLFLLGKSTLEIHDRLEGEESHGPVRIKASFTSVILQIILMDIIFSLDSVITAIGMVDKLAIMIIAVILSVLFMILAAGRISRFVENHPTVKILALSFLILIGVALIADGLDLHIPKGYIYFAMAFSVLVEMLNMRLRRKSVPLKLRHPFLRENSDGEVSS